MDLTIIIPHYNTPDKLRRMLDSIPYDKGIQVIVVDDLSTEGLSEYEKLKEEYGEKVEFYDNLPESKSAGGARNEGLSHAKGRWVLFGDADDYFEPCMWRAVSRYFDKDYDVIYFPPRAVMDDGSGRPSQRARSYADLTRALRSKRWTKKDRVRKEGCIRYAWCSPCSRVVRRDFLEKYHIRFECIKYANDAMYSAMIGAHAKKITADANTIYVITDSENSLTNCADPKKDDIRHAAGERAYAYIEEKAPWVMDVYRNPDKYRSAMKKLENALSRLRKGR